MKQKLLTRIDFNLICAEGQGNTYAERTHAQYIAALVTNEIFLPIDAQDLKFGIEQSDQLFATGLIEWKVTDNGTDLIYSGASRFGQWFRSAVKEVTPIFNGTDIKIFGSKAIEQEYGYDWIGVVCEVLYDKIKKELTKTIAAYILNGNSFDTNVSNIVSVSRVLCDYRLGYVLELNLAANGTEELDKLIEMVSGR